MASSGSRKLLGRWTQKEELMAVWRVHEKDAPAITYGWVRVCDGCERKLEWWWEEGDEEVHKAIWKMALDCAKKERRCPSCRPTSLLAKRRRR